MAITAIPSSSREYLHVTVTGDYTTAMPVEIAIVPYGIEPSDADWAPASWQGGQARILIGPGSAVGELDEGLYGVWVRVTTPEEAPVLHSGTIKITSAGCGGCGS